MCTQVSSRGSDAAYGRPPGPVPVIAWCTARTRAIASWASPAGRAQRATGPPPSLYRHLLVLPVLDTRPGPADPADRQVIRRRSWHRWSALCLLACICLAVAAASHRDRRPGLETGLIPL